MKLLTQFTRDKHTRMKWEKVRMFLTEMGAIYSPWDGGGRTEEECRRRYRKIKRLAFKRLNWPHRDDAYSAIYHAFELNKYTQYGGYYWKDFRRVAFVKDGWFTKFRPYSEFKDKLGDCRRWSLNGPKIYTAKLEDSDEL